MFLCFWGGMCTLHICIILFIFLSLLTDVISRKNESGINHKERDRIRKDVLKRRKMDFFNE